MIGLAQVFIPCLFNKSGHYDFLTTKCKKSSYVSSKTFFFFLVEKLELLDRAVGKKNISKESLWRYLHGEQAGEEFGNMPDWGQGPCVCCFRLRRRHEENQVGKLCPVLVVCSVIILVHDDRVSWRQLRMDALD